MAGVKFRGNQRTQPRWLADFLTEDKMERFPAKLDKSADFSGRYGVLVKINGAVLAAATSITVDALTVPQPGTSPTQALGQALIPKGSILVFGAPADGKLAILTEDANEGETSLTVEAVPTAIDDNDEAIWNSTNAVVVPAGTLVGWTYAVRNAAGAVLSPYVHGTHDELFLTAYTVWDLQKDNNVELLRPNHNTTIKENFLPDWATISADANTLADLRAAYRTIRGEGL